MPSVAFLLRRRRSVLITGAALTAAAFVIVLFVQHWLDLQPYMQKESILRGWPTHAQLSAFTYSLAYIAPVIPFLTLPVLLAFIPAVRRTNRKAILFIAASLVPFILFALLQAHRHRLGPWLEIYPGSSEGGLVGFNLIGAPLPILSSAVRFVMTAVMLCATIWFAAFCFTTTWNSAASRRPRW